MTDLFFCCMLGLGIWGMQRFGAGVCLGYDEDFNYLLHVAGTKYPCYAPSQVRMIITGVVEKDAPPCTCTYLLCDNQYNGVHILDRETSNDLCRDGDSDETPIRYESDISADCDPLIITVVVEHYATTGFEMPRIAGWFTDDAVPKVFHQYKDLEQRIVCGSTDGENIIMTEDGADFDATCCDFDNAIMTIDFAGTTT